MFHVFMFSSPTMLHLTDILQVVAVLLAVVVMMVVLRARRSGKAKHDTAYANENVCEHLKRALEFLEGWRAPSLPSRPARAGHAAGDSPPASL